MKLLIVVFVAVVGSFVVTMITVQSTSREVDQLSERIVSVVSPRIARMSYVRGSTLEVELALSRYVREESVRHELGPRLDAALAGLSHEIESNVSLATAGGSQLDELERSWRRFSELTTRTRRLADAGEDGPARQSYASQVEPAGSALVAAAMRTIERDARHARELGTRINDIRERTVWLANGLTLVSVLLGCAGAWLLHRQGRSRREADLAHARALEARADELELFAGRVAHDIKNPLSTARMAADALRLQQADDPVIDKLAGRIERSLLRADAITTSLLEFARSGARPDPGARTSVPEVIEDLRSVFEHEASTAGIALALEPPLGVQVACSPGVYMSLIGNLVRNAIKYMGEAGERRITIRTSMRGQLIRTEVIDTGPGIPSAELSSLFVPYFRLNRSREGLGLGLATVQRLAEGHGGRVGVVSSEGRGSTFFFDLPFAGKIAALDEDGEQLATRPEQTRH